MKRALPPQPRVVLSNGKRPCRGCGAELPARRIAWCSNECKEQHYMALSTHARIRIYQRDKGLCALCGADTEFLARIRWYLKRHDAVDAMVALKRAWGIDSESRPWSVWEVPTMWEADHVVPLCEGGTHALENYRTLCVPCHRQATRELRARLAMTRRERAGRG